MIFKAIEGVLRQEGKMEVSTETNSVTSHFFDGGLQSARIYISTIRGVSQRPIISKNGLIKLIVTY